jgi:Queuosine salvage protein
VVLLEPTERKELAMTRFRPAALLAEELGIQLGASPSGRINDDGLARVSDYVSGRADLRHYKPFAWNDPAFWLVDASQQERSQFFAIGTAINFRFWRMVSGRVEASSGTLAGSRLSGAMYMWRCLRLALERGLPLLDAKFLAEFSMDSYRTVFKDDHGRLVIDTGVNDRIKNLRDLGQRLLRRWDGEFWNVVRASQGNLLSFCRLSRRFRAFDDPLYKLTMLNVILHSGSGLSAFDRAPLPAIDYHLVKQMLRQGVVEPDASLGERLMERGRLTRQEAYELRRLTLLAFIRLSDITGVPGHVLDNLWWGNRTKCLDVKPVCSVPPIAASCPFLNVCSQVIQYGMPLENTRYY